MNKQLVIIINHLNYKSLLQLIIPGTYITDTVPQTQENSWANILYFK